MKQTNLIYSENVVNIVSPEKKIIFGAYACGNNGSFLLTETAKKHRFISNINKVANHSSFSAKNLKLCQNKFQ